MLSWLAANITTILIGMVLLVVVVAIVVSLIKNMRKDKSSCGCDCASCPFSGTCHQKR